MKRIVLFALACALFLGSAHAAVAVRMDAEAALLTEDGEVLVEAGACVDIVPLGEGLFAASADGEGYALMDASGGWLSPALYDELRLRGDRLLAHRDGGWGLLDRSGAELSAFDYDAILCDGEGGCWALRPEEDGEAVLSLDAGGRARDSGLRALEVGEPGEGLLPLRLDGGLWGYCDAEGNLAIPARYDWAGAFDGGWAVAVEGGARGAIDAGGAWRIEPRYDFLELSGEGFALASGGDGVELLARDGSVLAAYEGEDTWAALAGAGYVVCDGAALRLCDASGAQVEVLAPDASVSEGVGAQLVISEGMWGEKCVRLSGTDARYQNLFPLGTAGGEAVYACMEVNAARYENDLLHEIQVSVDMDSARYGLVNAAGEQLLPALYLSIECVADDRFAVRTESQWQLIGSDGRIYWRSRVMRIAEPSF